MMVAAPSWLARYVKVHGELLPSQELGLRHNGLAWNRLSSGQRLPFSARGSSMKLKMKLPAIVTDDEGHEQNIEVELSIRPGAYSRTGEKVSGFFIVDDYGYITGSFTFNEEHPFNTFPRSKS
jgi:hypothetical protein